MDLALTCKKGHELSGNNLYIWPKTGKRVCRTCSNQRTKFYRQKKSEANPKIDDGKYQTNLSSIELAWAAGLFEGEGTVTISGGGKMPYTRVYASISSTDREVVDYFQSRWHVRTITERTPQSSPNAKLAYTWRITSRQAIAFLKDIRPYIVTSRVQAKIDLAIEAQTAKQRGIRDVTGKYRLTQENFMAQMRILNKRGTK